MASSTNINGFNIGGNNNSFDQRGHFYRAFLDGNVSGMLVKQNSTPNMTVLVEHGSALLNKNTISASVAEIKSDTSVAIDTANTANPRIDSVVIYEDTSVVIPTVEANYWQDGAGGRFKLVSLPGTAAASPVALTDANIQSAIGAGKPFARLADITVPANSTTILNSNINNSVRNKLGVAVQNMNAGTTAGAVTADGSGNVSVISHSLVVNWTGWSSANFGTTETSLGTKSIAVPAGYNAVKITGSVRIQNQDSNTKDMSIYVRDVSNINNKTTLSTVTNNVVFAGSNTAVAGVVTATGGTTLTLDLRAVCSSGAANSNQGTILLEPCRV